jgi:hypothetical protein
MKPKIKLISSLLIISLELLFIITCAKDIKKDKNNKTEIYNLFLKAWESLKLQEANSLEKYAS